MIEIFSDIEQNTLEWLQIRAGIPTSSCFKLVQQKPGPRNGEPIGRITYMRKLAGEIITGQPMDNYVSYAMRRGKENEAEARDLYAMLRNVQPEQIGFIRNGNCGASPDALIGKDGLLEIKDAEPHVHIERLLDGHIPTEHKEQVQGQLMVSGRQWCDFMSHCPGMKPLIVRVHRNEADIAALRVDVDEFVDELDKLVEYIRSI